MRDPAGDPERRNPRASRATRGPKLSGSNSGDISRESSSSDTTPNDGDTQQRQRYRYWQDNVCYKHLKEEIREIGDTGDSTFPEDQQMRNTMGHGIIHAIYACLRNLLTVTGIMIAAILLTSLIFTVALLWIVLHILLFPVILLYDCTKRQSRK